MRTPIERSAHRWNTLVGVAVGAAALTLSLLGTARPARGQQKAAAPLLQQDTTCVALVDSLYKGLGGGRGGGGVRARALSCVDQADSSRRARVFVALSAQMANLAQLPWMIPEYHDEQPFADGNAYGPMAYIFASPYIGGFKFPWQIREQVPRGILAAVVYVDAPAGTALSTPYTNLFLQPGMNCIWLANTGTGAGTWTASVSPASGVSAVCDRSTPSAGTLKVSHETFGGLSGEDYPGAARFGEATNGQPLLGVRCLNAWCELGPVGFNPTPGLGGTARERRVRGWHDAQRLSIRDASGLHPGPRAIIVPRPNLDRLSADDFASTWKSVADIEFVDNPQGTKYEKWGLKQGVNHVEIRSVSGQWEFRVTPDGGAATIWTHVDRMTHYDAPVPGSARFRWTLLDEGIWIPCGDACCRADGE